MVWKRTSKCRFTDLTPGQSPDRPSTAALRPPSRHPTTVAKQSSTTPWRSPLRSTPPQQRERYQPPLSTGFGGPFSGLLVQQVVQRESSVAVSLDRLGLGTRCPRPPKPKVAGSTPARDIKKEACFFHFWTKTGFCRFCLLNATPRTLIER